MVTEWIYLTVQRNKIMPNGFLAFGAIPVSGFSIVAIWFEAFFITSL